MTSIYNLIPAPPSGAETKRRAAATSLKKATDESRRLVMFAKDLLVHQDQQERIRRDHLAAMTAEHAGVVAEIAATKAKLASLKAETLPAAQARMEAAQARLDALVGDVERAEGIANANALVSEASR